MANLEGLSKYSPFFPPNDILSLSACQQKEGSVAEIRAGTHVFFFSLCSVVSRPFKVENAVVPVPSPGAFSCPANCLLQLINT